MPATIAASAAAPTCRRRRRDHAPAGSGRRLMKSASRPICSTAAYASTWPAIITTRKTSRCCRSSPACRTSTTPRAPRSRYGRRHHLARDRHLRLFGGFNYTHARYTDFTDAIVSIPFPLAASTPPFSTTQFTYVDSGPARRSRTRLPRHLPAADHHDAGRARRFLSRAAGRQLPAARRRSGNRLQNTPTSPSASAPRGHSRLAPASSPWAGNFYHNGGFVATPDERVKQAAYSTVDASLTWPTPTSICPSAPGQESHGCILSDPDQRQQFGRQRHLRPAAHLWRDVWVRLLDFECGEGPLVLAASFFIALS